MTHTTVTQNGPTCHRARVGFLERSCEKSPFLPSKRKTNGERRRGNAALGRGHVSRHGGRRSGEPNKSPVEERARRPVPLRRRAASSVSASAEKGNVVLFGTIAALLLEIGSVYPALSSPTLSSSAAATAWNALGLLQTVAAHPETRTPFLEAGIPLYLLPFLNTTSEPKSFEYLRASSLGVLGALAKVATFIVQKIMLDEVGLQHICAAMECFFQAASVLASMVIALTEGPSTKLLKHIIGCYLRLTDDPRARTALQTHLHEALRDGTFDNCLRDDPATRHFLEQLLGDMSGPASGTQVVRQAQLEGPLKQAQVA